MAISFFFKLVVSCFKTKGRVQKTKIMTMTRVLSKTVLSHSGRQVTGSPQLSEGQSLPALGLWTQP